MTLIERARSFAENGNPEELTQLLVDCVATGNSEGLVAVQLLARARYGGDSLSLLLKAPAAYCLLAWRQDGIKALVENALEEPTFRNYSLAFDLLSVTTAGREPDSISWWPSDLQLREAVSSAVGDWGKLGVVALSNLNELMLSIEDDAHAAISAGMSLTRIAVRDQPQHAIKNLSHSLALRSIAVGPGVLAAYDGLLSEKGDDETIFQSFFESHPLMLDPRAFQVWAQPDLHGRLKPDFIIRTYEDNYVIVEIETPAKRLVTKRGNLGSDATHAVDQVLEYQDYLGTHIAEASASFPQFTNSTGLVIVGRESSLNARQKEVLRRVNQSRPNIRIVGFDALADTSKAVTSNVIHGIRETILGARLP